MKNMILFQALLHEVLLGKKQKEELTDKIDSYIMHPIGGILSFFIDHAGSIWIDFPIRRCDSKDMLKFLLIV